MKTLLRRAAVGLLAVLACGSLAMAQDKPVAAPSTFVPMQAAAYKDGAGMGQPVGTATPLPTGLNTLQAGEDLPNNVLGTITKPVIGTTYSASIDPSFATLVTHNAKATAGQMLGAYASNANAGVRFLLVFDSTGSTAGAPKVAFPIPAGTTAAPGSISLGSGLLGQNGLNFATGQTWAISTTAATYTAATAADHVVMFFYK
jgi:hypothetical protein